MAIKKEGVLTSLARTVGTTAGVIVVKTARLKDEVVKMGSAAVNPSAQKTAVKSAGKKVAAKRVATKKPAGKKRVSRVALKKTKKKKTSEKRA